MRFSSPAFQGDQPHISGAAAATAGPALNTRLRWQKNAIGMRYTHLRDHGNWERNPGSFKKSPKPHRRLYRLSVFSFHGWNLTTRVRISLLETSPPPRLLFFLLLLSLC